jgi:hypothetical protein
MNKTMMVLGLGLTAVAAWLIDLGLRQCQEEMFAVPCPESYYGLSIFIALTLGLTSIVISLSRNSKRT